VIRTATALVVAMTLAACSSDLAPAPSPGPQAPPATHGLDVEASALPVPPPTEKDQCGAADLQSLVGRPRSEIPVPVDPARQRVACTTCPVTLDHNPGRLNFFFDADSGLIKQIRCG
jgi:hypothetical protein